MTDNGAWPAHQRSPLAAATTRGLVLDLIRSRGPISRVELASATGLTQATMSTLARQLINDGLVVEYGRGESTGGKPRVLLDIDPMARFAVGIQLGADSVSYVVCNLAGTLVGRLRTRGAGTIGPEEAVEAMTRRVRVFVDALGIDVASVVGIGVVAPGPMDLRTGTILAPPTLVRWANFPLRERLATTTGLPVVLDNDATAAAVGEFWSGSIAESAAHCTVYLGAGLGAGIIIGGSVFRGASGNAGEVGRIRLDVGKRLSTTAEHQVMPASVAAAARRALAAGRPAGFELPATGDAFRDFDIVATAAIRGDRLAGRLIQDSARALATAVVAMANILDLDSVTLAGPSFAIAGTLYVEAVQESMATGFFARAVHDVTVRLSDHLMDAAAVGGASLVMQHQLAPRNLSAASYPANRT
ncbi:MAG TPA: ROK family transcriptional regulator [Nakamurella sp.]